MTSSYEPMLVLADRQIAQDEFVSNHVALEVITPGKEIEFFDLLTRAIPLRTELFGIRAVVCSIRYAIDEVVPLLISGSLQRGCQLSPAGGANFPYVYQRVTRSVDSVDSSVLGDW